ncbi:MAG TPA: tRNA (adenosine(37)-N6)-threonylcarbamoyltransferase complex dimerization subunit type 1 TsaB [Anaerolineales bacterium]|nr:tRNA (adenosine(37)-N6)-threonylcarbamoyltransferase complex dimerization subunit type 1 TsaB [Anaerolineales bacterium]
MLLAVDTSNAQMGLALYDGAQVIGEFSWRSSQRHTVELAPAVSDLIARCGLKIDQVTALGVALGPGSFTSLRVGLAFAKGLAMARRIPLIGIPTLDILARALPASDRPLGVAIRAGRGRFAFGWYQGSGNGWQAQGVARVVSLEALQDEVKSPSVICGEFTAEERQQLEMNDRMQLASPAESIRRPSVLAQLAWARLQNGEADDAASLAPLYLHTAAPIEI